MKNSNILLATSLKKMSLEELEEFQNLFAVELKERHRARKEGLVEEVCDATNTLLSTYPDTKFWFHATCPNCEVSFPANAFANRNKPFTIVDFN